MQQERSSGAESNEQDKVEELDKVLFPRGADFDQDTQKVIFEQYKILNQNTEQLAARRQAINGFLLSINTLILAGLGFIFKESFEVYVHEHRVMRLMLLAMAISVIGLVIDIKWSRLIGSYGKLLHGQVRILEALEKHTPAAVMTAQTAFYKKEFLSLSNLEKNIAHTFQVVYVLSVIGALIILLTVPSAPTVAPSH